MHSPLLYQDIHLRQVWHGMTRLLGSDIFPPRLMRRAIRATMLYGGQRFGSMHISKLVKAHVRPSRH